MSFHEIEMLFILLQELFNWLLGSLLIDFLKSDACHFPMIFFISINTNYRNAWLMKMRHIFVTLLVDFVKKSIRFKMVVTFIMCRVFSYIGCIWYKHSHDIFIFTNDRMLNLVFSNVQFARFFRTNAHNPHVYKY